MEPHDKDDPMRDDLKVNDSDCSGSSRKPACARSPSKDGLFTSAAHGSSTSNEPVASSSHAACDFQQSQPQPSTSTPSSDTAGCSGVNVTNSRSQNSLNEPTVNNINQDASSSRINDSSSNSALETNNDTCTRHSFCINVARSLIRSDNLAPSTSGTRRICENDIIDNSAFRESRKRPSSLKLNRPNFNEDGSSSDTGNDDYSLGSEDGCIYTYRGGEHLADLPSSFFSLDMGLPVDRQLPIPPNYAPRVEGQQPAPRSRDSSPDMDFLEMDFDPGPSCEADSGDEPSPDIELEIGNQLPIEEPVLPRGTTPELQLAFLNPIPIKRFENPTMEAIPPMSEMYLYGELDPTPSTSQSITQEVRAESATVPATPDPGPYITHVNSRGERLYVLRTMTSSSPHTAAPKHASSGDLVSPREVLNHEEDEEIHFAYQINQGERPTFDPVNLSSALYHLNMVKRLMNEDSAEANESNEAPAPVAPPRIKPTRCSACAQKNHSPSPQIGAGDQASASKSIEPQEPVAEVPRTMVWSEREACERQVTQIGTSACGATAVVNVFNALGIPVNIENINTAVGTRLRANHAPLPRYLLSRAVAGCTAADLVSSLHRASEGLVTARFFPTWPERLVSLSHWLADWISLGAVPILTLNLQQTTDLDFPDAWHHQMVFGVSPRGVYLCNPVECVRESVLWPRLTSPSVLRVRTRDVLSRFTPRTDLTPLMAVPDRRWHDYNVLGQVVHVIREWRSTGWSENGIRTRHIRIPASYQAGITIAALTGSEAHRRLMHAPQLPVLVEESLQASPTEFSNVCEIDWLK